jgi:glutathione S-transferase
MRANGIEMPLKSTTEAANRETLIAVGGSRQVPCLFIDGAPLYESGDIIEYLRENCCE